MPTEPYLLLQRQFEDDDSGVSYLETHDTDRFAGHFRLRLMEFTPTRLAFEIERPEDRTVEVTYKLSTRRFPEVQRIVHIILHAGDAGEELGHRTDGIDLVTVSPERMGQQLLEPQVIRRYDRSRAWSRNSTLATTIAAIMLMLGALRRPQLSIAR
jgi:hypothetical protein